jgi:uncharacterized damage-inducible protein DinB
MNEIDYIRSFYAYHTWATERLFATAAQLTSEQFVAPLHVSLGSLRDVLVHMVAAERSWLARVRDEQPPTPFALEDFTTVADVAATWRQVNATTQATLKQLRAEDFTQTVHFNGRDGKPITRVRWQMLVHQANHAAQHRAEVALIMTQLGLSTGDIDYFRYVDAG